MTVTGIMQIDIYIPARKGMRQHAHDVKWDGVWETWSKSKIHGEQTEALGDRGRVHPVGKIIH